MRSVLLAIVALASRINDPRQALVLHLMAMHEYFVAARDVGEIRRIFGDDETGT